MRKVPQSWVFCIAFLTLLIPCLSIMGQQTNTPVVCPSVETPAEAEAAAEARVVVANAYAFFERYETAIASYSCAIQLDSNLVEAYYRRGLAYSVSGNYEEALGDAETLDVLAPDAPYSATLRADVTSNRGDYEDAISIYGLALEIDAEFVDAYFGRAMAYYDLGEFSSAIEDFDQLLERTPGERRARFNRGLAYYELGDYGRAIVDFTVYIRLKGGTVDGYGARGNAYYAMGDYEGAVEDYTHLIEVPSSQASGYYRRGNAYRKMGEFEMAITDYEQSLLPDPTFADTYWALGLTYDALEDFNAALEYYQQYLDLAGEDASEAVVGRVQELEEAQG